MRVSVIIPTRNEAQALRHVLADIPASRVSEVLVVDSDSTLGTRQGPLSIGCELAVSHRKIDQMGDNAVLIESHPVAIEPSRAGI